MEHDTKTEKKSKRTGTPPNSFTHLLTTAPHTGEAVKRLRLAYSGFGVGTAVALVAKEAGLFKRYGLEIDEVYIEDAPAGGIQALIGVDIFLGSGNPVVPMQAILKGADIVFIGSHASMEHYKFGVSSKISSIKQLKGKKSGYPG